MARMMTTLSIAVTILLLGSCSGDEKPTSDEVEPALKEYLVAHEAKTCGGNVTLDRVTITSIGEFDKQLGGWPVYATFSVTCMAGSNSTSWKSDDPSTKTMASVARKTVTGSIECFMPEEFERAEQEMQNLFKKN